MNDLTEFEKRLYNCWLQSIAKAQKRGYRYKKDFSKIKPEDYTAIKKLGYFFASNEDVKPEEFFSAPFEMYPEYKWMPLSYYNGIKAINTYKFFCKVRDRKAGSGS